MTAMPDGTGYGLHPTLRRIRPTGLASGRAGLGVCDHNLGVKATSPGISPARSGQYFTIWNSALPGMTLLPTGQSRHCEPPHFTAGKAAMPTLYFRPVSGHAHRRRRAVFVHCPRRRGQHRPGCQPRYPALAGRDRAPAGVRTDDGQPRQSRSLTGGSA